MLIRTLWTAPDRLLAAKGTYYGEKPDKLVRAVYTVRSVVGLGILIYVAFAYPRYTGPAQELFPTSGNSPTAVDIVSKLAGSLLVTTSYGFAIFLGCFVLFAAPITLFTRSRYRWAVLRHLFIPLIVFVLFVVLLALITTLENVLSAIVNRIYASTYHPHQLGSLLIGALALLVPVSVGVILLVVEFKAIYLAATDLFRADDAHPLLAPFASTVVSWAFVGIAWLTGGPTGIPDWLRWSLLLGGPIGISAISIGACWRLWWKHPDILFRDGPTPSGQGMAHTTASPLAAGAARSRREVIAVSLVLAVFPPLLAILIGFGPLTVYLSPNSSLGSLEWFYSTGDAIYSSPMVVGGVVYIGSNDHKVYALSAVTGRLRWAYGTGDAIYSRPAVVGGTLYVGSDDGKVYALDAASGDLSWSYKTRAPVDSSPTVVGGAVYIGSGDNELYALDAATGQRRWAYKTGGGIYSSPTVAGSAVYVGSDDDKIYALDAGTGRLRWAYKSGGAVDSSSVIVGGVVYIGSDDGNVYALDAATGDVRWTYGTGDAIYSRPAVVGGTLYVGSNDGKVYAVTSAG